MLPPLRQRLLVVVSVIVGALVWSLSADALRAADGSAGLTLIDAGVGIFTTLVFFIVPGIPALILGMVVSATGTALAGLFVVAAALGVLAAFGGGIEHWIRGATPPLSTRFLGLAFEMILWGAGVIAVLALYVQVGDAVRGWARSTGLTGADDAPPQGPRLLVRLCAGAVGLWGPRGEETFRAMLAEGGNTPGADLRDASALTLPDNAARGQAILAGGVSVFVAGVLAFLLIRSPETEQVFWSLFVAFLIGGLAGRIAVPGCSPWGIVASPAVVGTVGYFWALLLYGNDRDAYLAALFSSEQSLAAVPGISLALPVHYASAGVVGVTLGIGWARHFAVNTRRPQ